MAVENADYLSQLDATLPLFNDVVREGDNHIRLKKKVFKQTFPGENGNGFNTPILATEAELNYLQGVTSNIQGQLNAITPGLVPIGGIIPFTGAIVSIPANFALCDGANGTPNLIDRFVFGTAAEGELSDVGGTTDRINVSHTHNFDHTHTGSTSLDGSHSHTASVFTSNLGTRTGLIGAYAQSITANFTMSAAGNHTHTLTIDDNALTVQNAGVTGVGANIPPYVAMAFIQRIT